MTWDLTPIFSSDQEFDKKYEELTEELKILSIIKGTLGNGATAFLEALEFVLTMYRKVELYLCLFPFKNDQDTTDTTYQALYARAGSLLSKVSEAIAWYEPEVLQLSDEQIWQYFEEEPKLEVYRHYVKQMVDNRAHYLVGRSRSITCWSRRNLRCFKWYFAVLNNADLEFPTITGENGEKIQLSHGVYGQLLESTNREVREAAFKGLYSVYAQFRNTFASHTWNTYQRAQLPKPKHVDTLLPEKPH